MYRFTIVNPQRQHRFACTPAQFLTNLQQTQNFLLASELFAFEMKMPPIADVIDILRRDDETRVRSPVETIKDEEGELTRWVRTAPIEELIDTGGFAMSNFELSRFYEPNNFLHEFQDRFLQHYFLNCNNNLLPGVMGGVASQGAAAARPAE